MTKNTIPRCIISTLPIKIKLQKDQQIFKCLIKNFVHVRFLVLFCQKHLKRFWLFDFFEDTESWSWSQEQKFNCRQNGNGDVTFGTMVVGTTKKQNDLKIFQAFEQQYIAILKSFLLLNQTNITPLTVATVCALARRSFVPCAFLDLCPKSASRSQHREHLSSETRHLLQSSTISSIVRTSFAKIPKATLIFTMKKSLAATRT